MGVMFKGRRAKRIEAVLTALSFKTHLLQVRSIARHSLKGYPARVMSLKLL
jgi:hypothetical protein